MTNDRTPNMWWPHWAWPSIERVSDAVVAVALLAFVAACGGSSKSPAVANITPTTSTLTASSSASPTNATIHGDAVAYSACMRSHGVAKFPDPNSSDEIPKIPSLQQLGVSSSQFAAAKTACRALLPTGVEASVTLCLSTGNCPQSLVQQMMSQGREFALCMRNHGVTNFPDPTMGRNGSPVFDLGSITGTNWRSTQIEQKLAECAHVYSAGMRVGLNRPGP